jgi:hypothetical protein
VDAGRRLGAAEQGETPGRSQGDLADVAMCNSSTVRSVIKFAIEAGLIIVKDGTIMLDPAWLKYLRGYAAANQEDWSLFA